MAVTQDPGSGDARQDMRIGRLAEMVVHLTDCAPERALAAVKACRPEAGFDADEALTVVARAMTAVAQVDLRDAVDLRDRAARGAARPARR